MALDVFGYLAIGVIGFIAIRIIFEAFARTMKGHTEPAETCKRCQREAEVECQSCGGKQESQDTSEQAEWCDCPNHPTSDKHGDN